MLYDPGYDPRDFRTGNDITKFEAYNYILKGCLGIGFLAMPSAFKMAGYINGVIFSLVFGFLILYAIQILFNSVYIVCQRKSVPYLTYPQAMEYALKDGPPCLRWLSNVASCFINCLVSVYHFQICSIYVIFLADTLQQVGHKNSDLDLRFYMLGLFIPLAVLLYVAQLKFLFIMSFVANTLLIVGCVVLLYYIIDYDDSKTVRHKFGLYTEFPLFYGIVLYIIEPFGMILAVEERMKNPKTFLGNSGILSVSMMFVIALNTIIGFLGYWKYGDEVRGSISMNLPGDEILADIAVSIFGFSITISYALHSYSIVDVIWTNYLKAFVEDYNYERYQFSIQIFITVASIICAMLIARFSHYLFLVGAFHLSLLGLIFPGVMELCVKYPDDYGQYCNIMVRDIFMITVGFIGCVVGCYYSIAEIEKHYNDIDYDLIPTYFGLKI